MTTSVAPFEPERADEIRDNPPKGAGRKQFDEDGIGLCHSPVMEIDEEKSTQGSDYRLLMDTMDHDNLNKRMYLKEYKLPSGLSMEMPE